MWRRTLATSPPPKQPGARLLQPGAPSSLPPGACTAWPRRRHRYETVCRPTPPGGGPGRVAPDVVGEPEVWLRGEVEGAAS